MNDPTACPVRPTFLDKLELWAVSRWPADGTIEYLAEVGAAMAASASVMPSDCSMVRLGSRASADS